MATIKDIQKLLKRAINPKSFIIIITSTAILTATVATEKPNFELESNSSLQENLELPKNFFLDYTKRFVKYRGKVSLKILEEIDKALAIIFGID